MNYILAIFFVLSIILGILNGFCQISNARENPYLGYPPSKNIFTFLFTDKY